MKHKIPKLAPYQLPFSPMSRMAIEREHTIQINSLTWEKMCKNKECHGTEGEAKHAASDLVFAVSMALLFGPINLFVILVNYWVRNIPMLKYGFQWYGPLKKEFEFKSKF